MKLSFVFGMLLTTTCLFAASKVEVVAVHSVTHNDEGQRSTIDKGIFGDRSTTKQIESYNLDAVIDGEHVLLACDDPKGCEAPALGIYNGDLKRGKWIHLTFTLPVTHKSISRWYKIAGGW